MKQPLLSILIPTVVGREESLSALIEQIKKQKGYSFTEVKIKGYYEGSTTHYMKSNDEEIWIEVWLDNKQISIGEKRELMYQHSQGRYSLMVDDDDLISDNAIEIILQAIKENPEVDCITFEEYCLMNGVEFRSNHSLKYDDWADNFDGYDFVRTPFYKDVIKTSIAQSVPFEKIRYGEDHAWSRVLKPHLKTEYHIPQQLYRYIHNSKPENHNERYGLNSE